MGQIISRTHTQRIPGFSAGLRLKLLALRFPGGKHSHWEGDSNGIASGRCQQMGPKPYCV